MKLKLVVVGMMLIVFIIMFSASKYSTNISTLPANQPTKEIQLPTYPPIWERDPEMFDSKTLSEIKLGRSSEEKLNIDENTSVNLKGFVGKYYSMKINNVIKVLDNTVTIHNKNGNWSSLGLIRNETNETLNSTSIIAVLLDRDGNLLDEIENTILIEGIRPGEPAPFSITSSIPLENVFKVEWKVKEIQSSTKIRDFIIYVNWQLSFGSDMHGWIKREDAPYPYVISTSAENLGKDADTVKIVIAWINNEGKVVWIEESNLSADYGNGIPQNGIGNFEDITVTDSTVGPLLSELQYLIWVVGE